MIRVTENLREIRDLLANAAVDAGRSPEAVELLAVSKKQPLSSIVKAADVAVIGDYKAVMEELVNIFMLDCMEDA